MYLFSYLFSFVVNCPVVIAADGWFYVARCAAARMDIREVPLEPNYAHYTVETFVSRKYNLFSFKIRKKLQL